MDYPPMKSINIILVGSGAVLCLAALLPAPREPGPRIKMARDILHAASSPGSQPRAGSAARRGEWSCEAIRDSRREVIGYIANTSTTRAALLAGPAPGGTVEALPQEPSAPDAGFITAFVPFTLDLWSSASKKDTSGRVFPIGSRGGAYPIRRNPHKVLQPALPLLDATGENLSKRPASTYPLPMLPVMAVTVMRMHYELPRDPALRREWKPAARTGPVEAYWTGLKDSGNEAVLNYQMGLVSARN